MPDNPKIFHIVHIDHLASIIKDNKLFSDAVMSRRPDEYGTKIGMGHIKERRLKKQISGDGHGVVGQYVPFYFCPRSVMLFIMFKRQHPDISYRGGQEPIIHLVSDVDSVIEWARSKSKKWAFTNTNAGAGYAEFFYRKEDMSVLKWDLIRLKDFRPQEVKDAKQSEFLVWESFDWELIKGIAVYNESTRKQVEKILEGSKHKPVVKVVEEWYY